MKTPSLHHFETFLAVAQQGGITAAAKKLGISKASVSQSIRKLEESLALPLFIRDTRNITLTEEGAILFDQCLRLNAELQNARHLVSGFKRSPSGVLRVNSTQFFAKAYLLDVITLYMEMFPDVEVEIFAEERMPDMLREHIDIVCGVNWPAPPDVIAKVIGKTRYVICASPAYLAKYGTPTTLEDLSSHRYIPHLGRTAENIIVSLKKKQTVALKSPLRMNSATVMTQAALNGTGIVQLHDYMIADHLASGELVEILGEFLQPENDLYAYFHRHRFVQPKVREFITLLEKATGNKR